MGFWTGVARAYRDISEERTQDRRIQEQREAERQRILDEREYQRELIEEERAFQIEQFNRNLKLKRQEILAELWSENQVADEASDEYVGKTAALRARLGDAAETDLGQKILANPTLAADLETQIAEEETRRAKNDIDGPALSGQPLLDMLEVYGLSKDTNMNTGYTLDEVLGLDLTDDENFFKTYAELASSETSDTGYGRLSPEALRTPDPSTLEEGRAIFGNRVLERANQEITRLESLAEQLEGQGNRERAGQLRQEAMDLRDAADNYEFGEPSQANMVLNSRFGTDVYQDLLQTDNPYIQNFEEDPLFDPIRSSINTRQEDIRDIRNAINSPETTPEERQQLIQILQQEFGINYNE